MLPDFLIRFNTALKQFQEKYERNAKMAKEKETPLAFVALNNQPEFAPAPIMAQ